MYVQSTCILAPTRPPGFQQHVNRVHEGNMHVNLGGHLGWMRVGVRSFARSSALRCLQQDVAAAAMAHLASTLLWRTHHDARAAYVLYGVEGDKAQRE